MDRESFKENISIPDILNNVIAVKKAGLVLKAGSYKLLFIHLLSDI